MPIYDEIQKQSKVKHILVRHEQAAVHAADAYARSTNESGVALVTSGPGVTNAVTGASYRVYGFDSNGDYIGTSSYPCYWARCLSKVDAVGITRPCVKHNFLVKNVDDISITIKKAFHIASTGRPGPVLVDIFKDIATINGKCSTPKQLLFVRMTPLSKMMFQMG